jgi:2-polyprenyl-3-methyl-5-hydroxy-6-metoxy-1,4-benzoquinol methylase
MFRLQRLSTSAVHAHRLPNVHLHEARDNVRSDSSADLIAEMQAYYERRAAVYDASMGYEDPSVVRSLEPVMQALRDAMHDRIVLEVACGPGFWTTCLAESARFILATDYNEATLSLARAKPIDPLRAHFVCVDAYDLSSIETTFTGAVAVDWLAHVPRSRLQPFLDGLHRRLAPGAHVVFCDQTPGPTSITGQHDPDGNHLQERILPDGSKHRVIKHFFSDDELRSILAPYADSIEIQRFHEQRRLIVHYTI